MGYSWSWPRAGELVHPIYCAIWSRASAKSGEEHGIYLAKLFSEKASLRFI